MRKYFFVIVLLCVSISVPVVKIFAAGTEMIFSDFSDDSFQSSTIDQFDTVIFDLSQAVTIGNLIAFPVSIHSDDSIYSLDFSLKYDHAKLEYDTIYDLTNYMQSLSHYNSFDSTVRFTSSSFQQYTHDTVLAAVQFIINSGGININDINNVEAYLNGAPCSVLIIDPLLSVDSDINEESDMIIYPNPASDWLNISNAELYSIKIFNVFGKEVFSDLGIAGTLIYSVNLQNLNDGIYFLEMICDSKRAIRSFIKAE